MNTASGKQPSLLKRLEKRFKNLYLNLRIYWHYQELNPTVVKLSQSDQRVSVNPADARARKKLIVDSLRGRLPRNQLFWRAACEELNPALVLDVGVNYGECLFSVDYQQQTRVIGVEANPFLMPHLEKSQRYHQSDQQIEIHNVLAGETPCDAISFFINQVTSGESTAAAGSVAANPSIYKQVSVPQICIDDLLRDELQDGQPMHQPIVFKIDVEGYEQRVFQGMQQLLASQLDLVGFIEFDLAMLNDASSDPEQFFDFLKQHFEIHLFVGKEVAVPVHQLTYQELYAQLSNVKFHSDLLLIRSTTPNQYANFVGRWEPAKMSA